MPINLDQLNTAPQAEAAMMLDGLYEHSPWIAEAALKQRPFASLAALKHAMVRVLNEAGVEPQLALIRAHPELAGKAMVSKTLTSESTNEQSKAGLTHCTPEEFARIQRLNADYNAKHGFPFILAVRGPRGTGLRSEEHTSELQSQSNLIYPLFFFNDTATTEIYPFPYTTLFRSSSGSTPTTTRNTASPSSSRCAARVAPA